MAAKQTPAKPKAKAKARGKAGTQSRAAAGKRKAPARRVPMVDLRKNLETDLDTSAVPAAEAALLRVLADELDRQRKAGDGISAALVKQYREALAASMEEAPMKAPPPGPEGVTNDDNGDAGSPVGNLARYRNSRGAAVGDTASA